MTISIVNEKGGSGKTTLAVNLACKLAATQQVLLIDADPQRSAESFANIRNQENLTSLFNIMTRLGSGLSREIQSLKSKFDTLIIDTGGRDTSEMRQSLVVSDIAIIPTIPSQYDVIILDKMLAIIDEARAINDKLKVFVLICKASPNPSLKRKIAELQEYIEDKNLADLCLLKSIIYEREAFRTATTYGKGITEFCSQKDKAYADFVKFYKEFDRAIKP